MDYWHCYIIYTVSRCKRRTLLAESMKWWYVTRMKKSIHLEKKSKNHRPDDGRGTASAQWSCHVQLDFHWLTSFSKKTSSRLHLYPFPIATTRSVVIVQTTREKYTHARTLTHTLSKIESFISLQKNILCHVTDELNWTTTCCQCRFNLVRYDWPTRIHCWALWQEAVEPSQRHPFPPQPQCEVHSLLSGNKYGNIQEHRL